MIDKSKQLLTLARQRKATKWSGYKNISDYQSGIYDCDYVSPYSKFANNTESDIMIILQDWCSDSFLNGEINQDLINFGHSPKLPTNKNLTALLKTHFEIDLKDTYATNLFPFIKIGQMINSIPLHDLRRAAEKFAKPQIDIMSPKLVICFGLKTFNALRFTTKLKSVKNIEEGLRNSFYIANSLIFCQSHCGTLGKINRNKGAINRVEQDWDLMAKKYFSLKKA